jgi:hypothetical protein
VKILCDADESVVREKRTKYSNGKLPLHAFIHCRHHISEVSDEGDCFRLLLRLYPAAAGIKDDKSNKVTNQTIPMSPYDLAINNKLSTYFVRLLLRADPNIDPLKRHNLNFEARKQGLFLAFRAISGDRKPPILAKIRSEGLDLIRYVFSYF